MVLKMNKISYYFILFFSFFIYSLALLFSKLASDRDFILFFSISIVMIITYAILWQTALKKINLNIAYSMKSLTIILTYIFGRIFFGEQFLINEIVSIIIIIFGVFLVIKL